MLQLDTHGPEGHRRSRPAERWLGKGKRPVVGRNTTSSGPQTRLGGREPASMVCWGTARAQASGAQAENHGVTAKCDGLSLALQRPSLQH